MVVVAPSVGVHCGLYFALTIVDLVRSWSNRGECGGEVVEGLCECCTRVPDGNGDEFHPPPMSSEGRNEGGVLIGLLRVFLLASWVSEKSNLDEDESAQLLVDVCETGVGCVRDASCVYEVRSCAVVFLEESLCLFLWEDP